MSKHLSEKKNNTKSKRGSKKVRRSQANVTPIDNFIKTTVEQQRCEKIIQEEPNQCILL
jgi:hypothetical protein